MRISALIASLLLLTACGSNGDSDSGSASSGYGSIEAVGKAAKCQPLEIRDDPMMFAIKTAGCTLPSGEDVAINWFANDTARDEYVDLGSSNGALYVTGSKWAIECNSAESQAEAAKSTKGDVKG